MTLLLSPKKIASFHPPLRTLMGPGLGPLASKIWRFGLMGYSCKAESVILSLSALGSVLSDRGCAVDVGQAEVAAYQAYAAQQAAAAKAKAGKKAA